MSSLCAFGIYISPVLRQRSVDDEDVPPAVRKFLKGAKPHKSCPAQPRDSVPEQRKLDRKPGGGLGKSYDK